MIHKIGDWKLASTMLATMPGKLDRTINIALAREAQLWRTEIIKGITSGKPGGKPYAPLSDTTKAIRKVVYGSSQPKPLMRRGDFRRSISVQKIKGGYFVGVARGEKTKDGKDMVNIAAVHEFGSKTIVLNMSEAMRRYLAMIFRKAGLPYTGGQGGGGIIMINIPARPTFGPVAAKLRPEAPRRVARTIAQLLGLGI